MKRRIIGLADGWPYCERTKFTLLPGEEKALNELKELGYDKLESAWIESPKSVGRNDRTRYGTLYLYAVKEENEPITE